jgi:hypothetical protein
MNSTQTVSQTQKENQNPLNQEEKILIQPPKQLQGIPNQEESESIIKSSESSQNPEKNLESTEPKNEDHISEILEVILGDYLPGNYRASPTLKPNSTEKAAIVLEELLLVRK